MWEGPDLTSLGALAVYAVLWGFIFAECALLLGFLLPGDTILFGAGLVAGAPNSDVNIYLLAGGAFVAAVVGNEVAYTTGKRFGRDWVEGREKGRAREQLRRAEGFYDKYGWWSVVIARWIPWVRTFIPIIAGTAAMDRRAFTSANVVGALPWAVGLPFLGYFAFQVPVLRDIAYAVAGIAILGFIVSLVVAGARSRRRAREERDSAGPDRDGEHDVSDPSASAEPARDQQPPQ
ncbi:MAG: DedA family protein [Actinobacteria bacterium]|nr:DedA family protein [Actinomycetota bacterium]